MSNIPYFLDKPESNQGIIRQVIFPKFRGINKFLYQRLGEQMIFKEFASSPNEEVVQFEKFFKSPDVLEQIKLDPPDLTLVTQIYHDLMVECLASVGMSEYLEFPKEILALPPATLQTLKFSAGNKDYDYCIEKLLNAIIENYVILVSTHPILTPFLPNFTDSNPFFLSNLPKIAEDETSEHYKYTMFLSPTDEEKGLFTGDAYKQFNDDTSALAFSYAFYYAFRDSFFSSFLEITLPVPTPPTIQKLGLNILNEIVLDLKNLPIDLPDPTKTADVLEKINEAVTTGQILSLATAQAAIVDYDSFRKNQGSEEELKGKLINIHNYYDNNPDNIPVIQMEGD
jgi:hypothetical protein